MAIEAEALRARLEAKAQEQIDYWRKRQAAEKALEDGVSEDGMSYTPMGDHAAWQAGYCNGRMSEADWWLQTLTLEIPDLIRSALAEDTARAAEEIKNLRELTDAADWLISCHERIQSAVPCRDLPEAIAAYKGALTRVSFAALPLDKEAADANR